MKVISLHTDIQLFEELKKGNEQAIRLLFERYYESLCRFSFQYLQEKALAEEVVADVFMQVWTKRKSLTVTQSVKAYLFKSTAHSSLNALRSRKAVCGIEMLDAEKANENSPEYQLISAENATEINQLLKCLSEPVKAVFLLQREEGFTYQEIAGLLHISVKTVESHMTKALKLLKEEFRRSSLSKQFQY